LTVQECGECVYGHRLAGDVHEPDASLEPCWEEELTLDLASQQEELNGEAAEDEDAELPLFPPLQDT